MDGIASHWCFGGLVYLPWVSRSSDGVESCSSRLFSGPWRPPLAFPGFAKTFARLTGGVRELGNAMFPPAFWSFREQLRAPARHVMAWRWFPRPPARLLSPPLGAMSSGASLVEAAPEPSEIRALCSELLFQNMHYFCVPSHPSHPVSSRAHHRRYLSAVRIGYLYLLPGPTRYLPIYLFSVSSSFGSIVSIPQNAAVPLSLPLPLSLTDIQSSPSAGWLRGGMGMSDSHHRRTINSSNFAGLACPAWCYLWYLDLCSFGQRHGGRRIRVWAQTSPIKPHRTACRSYWDGSAKFVGYRQGTAVGDLAAWGN